VHVRHVAYAAICALVAVVHFCTGYQSPTASLGGHLRRTPSESAKRRLNFAGDEAEPPVKRAATFAAHGSTMSPRIVVSSISLPKTPATAEAMRGNAPAVTTEEEQAHTASSSAEADDIVMRSSPVRAKKTGSWALFFRKVRRGESNDIPVWSDLMTGPCSRRFTV